MTRSSTLLALAAAVLPSIVAAQGKEGCAFFHIPPWICDVCDGYNPSAPIVCNPFNATFDDLTAGKPVGNYDSAQWTNFQVATPGKTTNSLAPHIRPASSPNYALVPAGKTGNVTFTGEFPEGRLYSLHYACALPITHSPTYYLAAPVACTVTVTAKCLPMLEFPDPGNETTTTFELAYEPTGYPTSNMSFARTTMPESGQCRSYAFEARSEAGVGVDFLVDEVLYNTYQQGFAR